MGTVLAYTSPARGHLFPMMDVLLELRARGHRVVVQTLSDEARRVREVGLEHRPISSEIEAIELRDHEAANPLHAFRVAVDTWLRRAPHEVEDLRRAVEEVAPDFLLIDANTFGASAFAETSDIPWALHMPYCLPTASRDAPAFGPGFAPPRSALARARDSFVRWAMNKALSNHVARLNGFRERLGAAPLGEVADLYAKPPAILYRTSSPFEYARSDWAENVVPIGPGLWAPDEPLPDWVPALPEPRVLVTISTEAQHDGAIIETAIAALASEVGSVICTTSAESPDQFTTTADNVRVVKFLPHAAVMPHLACVVCHGGMGTVQRALAAGVPICVVPWGRDQSETAQRTVVADAGTRLDPPKLTADRLRVAVREAMAKGAGAQAVAAGFRDAGGARHGADVVERALAPAVSSAEAARAPAPTAR